VLQPSDSLATYLKTMGYSGSVNDMLYAYLISINGLTFGSISLNDLIHRTLVGWGYTGTLSDMIASFMAATAGGGLANYPRSLFSANEQGIWLDPSDFSTLFQDAAGTTPVTAVGQPVGLALDKRLGLVLGSERVTNGNFASGTTGWTNNGGLATTFEAVTHDGEASTLHVIGGLNAGAVQVSLSANSVFTVTYKIKVISGSVYVGISGSTVGGVHTTSDAAAWKTVTRFVYGASDANLRIYSNGAGGEFYVTSVSVKQVTGNHAYQTTSASRPTLQQDSNGLYYLSFDGIDDFLVTPSVNFTGTDKMTVWAGVRKLSDVAIGVVVELSTNSDSTNGTFTLAASVGGNTYYAQSRGTVRSTRDATGYVAPHSAVLVAEAKISTDILRLHVNNAAPLSSATDQGTGNYGNYPLYIGRRGGTTLPFNGRLYQLIVRGAESNAGQIAATEAYVNAKTRAYA